MFRWAVDTTGIDIDADLMREQEPVSVRRTSRTPVSTTEWGKAKAELKTITDASHRTLGEVHILQRHELLDEFQQKAERTVLLSGNVPPFITRPNTSSTVEDGDSDVNVTEESGKDLRIFTTFLSSTSKLTAVNVTMKQQSYKGLDIVAAFLQQAVAVDERVNQRFSLNPRLYKLFIADEFTGEDEMPVQLDSVALDFSHYAVHPLPAAKLFLFPQRQELLPMVTNDIDLTVNVRPSDPQGKVIQRRCCVPADLLAESLENVITRRLPASGIVAGSLRIMYGPLELNINESYNFGAGCGQMSCPIAERTVLSLIRFGVTEVVVSGRCVEEFSGASFADVEDIVVEMDVEQALSFQQFEVIFINAYGARQQRFLCIDGEHLYTMRPYSVATDSVPKMRERMIKDIEEVKLYPNKPKYMEIIYCAESRFEEDHFECTTPYNCAVVDEKIRLLRRELRKREAESTPEEAPVGVVKRFLHGFKLGLFT